MSQNISEIENNQTYQSEKEFSEKISFKKKIQDTWESYWSAYKSLPIKKIFIVWITLGLSILFFILTFMTFNQRFLITIPAYGGEINEGILGTVRFINPVLAYSNVDKDLTNLIYAGLTKKDVNGNIIMNLAENISITPDGLHYQVKIKEKAIFHDGQPVTSEDIIYTINLIQDKSIDSPLALNFEGVTINKINDKELIFNLKKPFIYFQENLNVGILPKHLWQNLTAVEFPFSDYNLKPIGAGPYQVSEIIKESNMVKEIQLNSFKKYVLNRPYINNLNIFIYINQKTLEEDFKEGKINRISKLGNAEILNIKPAYATSSAASYGGSRKATAWQSKMLLIATSSLPNLYSLSLNPNKNILLADKNLRLALAAAINKNEIIQNIFQEKAEIANSNLVLSLNQNKINQTQIGDQNSELAGLELAKKYLAKYLQNKSKKTNIKNTDLTKIINSGNIKSNNNINGSSTENSVNPVPTSIISNSATSSVLGTINISTVDTEELKLVAELIKNYWQTLGFNVNIKVYELSDLSANVIKNRDFEILLFGAKIEKDTDLFAYWSSTQRNYPGLNITSYVSKNLDKNLEIIRNSQNPEERKIASQNIDNELQDEMPAIPLYTKIFTYYINNQEKSSAVIPKFMNSSEVRFENVENWFMYTEEIWNKIYFQKIIETLQNIIH